MSTPLITGISSTNGNVGDNGIIISGTALDGNTFSLLLYDNEFTPHDISTYVSYKSFNQVRFTVPPYISGTYYVVIETDAGKSNAF